MLFRASDSCCKGKRPGCFQTALTTTGSNKLKASESVSPRRERRAVMGLIQLFGLLNSPC